MPSAGEFDPHLTLLKWLNYKNNIQKSIRRLNNNNVMVIFQIKLFKKRDFYDIS